MTLKFPSKEWTDAFARAVNDNPAYQKHGKPWTFGAVAMVVRPDPALGIDAEAAMVLDVHEGQCRGATYGGLEITAGAPFVIVADYARWRDVIEGRLDPIKGMMEGKLKLTTGHLPTMIRFVESSRALVRSAEAVPTEFPVGMTPNVELAPGADANGFAEMLAQMLRQNLDDHEPKRRALARMRGRVAIVVEDLALAITLVFEGGRVTVHDGIRGIPDATVRASSDYVTKMSLVELEPRTGLPDPRGEVAREVFEASKRGDIRVLGLLSSLPLIARMTRVMSVHPG